MRLQRLRRALIAFLSASMMGPEAAASQSPPITWTMTTAERLVEQGRPFRVLVHADIPKGSHLYALTQPAGGPMAATIVADSSGVFALAGAVVARTADRALDQSFGIATETYSDSVTFAVPIVAQQSGADRMTLTVHYQSCTDRLCLPPKSAVLSLALSVAPGSAIASPGYSLLPTLPKRGADADANADAGAAGASSAAAANLPVDQRTRMPRAIWIAVALGAVLLCWVLFRRSIRD